MPLTDANIENVYDSIAEGWYHLRQNPFVIFNPEKYAKSWPEGKLLDVGCGNGAYSIVFAKHGFRCVGVDASGQMLRWAKKNTDKNKVSFPLIRANCLDLPFKDNTFDYALSVAVFHHLDSEDKRLKAFGEVFRVLKPNGIALVTAWNKTQPRFIFRKADRYVAWNHKGTAYQRYYHMFAYGEMGYLAKRAGFRVLKLFPEESYKLPVKTFSKNVCALLKKQI
ncbi:MAG: class I SAM-dependent methyltransferase [Candidatus Aenigmarchaeota archaeon]|nr:class I SAM-dependent methyltransferase [Candidatus Aenigmarchaeota archaeon]